MVDLGRGCCHRRTAAGRAGRARRRRGRPRPVRRTRGWVDWPRLPPATTRRWRVRRRRARRALAAARRAELPHLAADEGHRVHGPRRPRHHDAAPPRPATGRGGRRAASWCRSTTRPPRLDAVLALTRTRRTGCGWAARARPRAGAADWTLRSRGSSAGWSWVSARPLTPGPTEAGQRRQACGPRDGAGSPSPHAGAWWPPPRRAAVPGRQGSPGP